MKYKRPGSRRLTPYKRGYLDALTGGARWSLGLRGRRAADYTTGYAAGIYWGTMYRWYRMEARHETKVRDQVILAVGS